MSGGEVRKVSRQDIQLVQNLIERCLQLYMNQKEVVDTLSYQAKIEPSFTELVWQKLEEENREFFNAYYVRLMLKNQILVFNRLLEDQYRLMTKEHSSGVTSAPPLSNGSNTSALNQNTCYLSAACTPPTTMPDNMLCNGASGSSSASTGIINNGGPSQAQAQAQAQLVVHPTKEVHILNPSNMSSSSTSSMNPIPNPTSSNRFNGVLVNGATAVKIESSYTSNSDFTFADTAFLEPCPSIGDAPAGSFSNSELTGQPLSDPILDIDSSFGFLSQIPRNFSFSDLTEDFTQSADILENYGRSPFLPPEPSNFSDSGGGCKDGGNRRLDTISEGVSYEDFGSN